MTLPDLPDLAQQLAPTLLPFLPYLLKGAKSALDLATAAWRKLGEVEWDTVFKIWERIKPQIDRQPEVKKHLEEAAQKPDDPRAAALVSWDLEKILAALPPQQVSEIHQILTQTRTESRTVTASGERAVAIGGDAPGASINTGDQTPPKK